MNRSCVNRLKSLIVALHFLCWLCGAFVVAFGEFQMMHSRFASLVTTFWPIYPANTLVVTGTIVTCVCYLGILGGMKENRCMLIAFYILLFILMLVELAMALVFLVYSTRWFLMWVLHARGSSLFNLQGPHHDPLRPRWDKAGPWCGWIPKINKYFESDLMQSLEIYRMSSPEGNQTIRQDFDAVQHLFQCCGVHSQADWRGSVPISCCIKDPCNTVLQTNWEEGCLEKLKDWFSRNYLSTGAGVVTMFILQVLCLSITIPLFSHFSQQGLGYQ